ncbi:unnamed protein product, partial [marine sediment metagenome]
FVSQIQKIENLVEHDKTLSSAGKLTLEKHARWLRKKLDQFAATSFDFNLH